MFFIIKQLIKIMKIIKDKWTPDVGTQLGKNLFPRGNSKTSLLQESSQMRQYDILTKTKTFLHPPSQPRMKKSNFKISSQGNTSCQLGFWPLSSLFCNLRSSNIVLHPRPCTFALQLQNYSHM